MVISTIHAAKGLEWDVCFGVRWNDGFLPTLQGDEVSFLACCPALLALPVSAVAYHGLHVCLPQPWLVLQIVACLPTTARCLVSWESD